MKVFVILCFSLALVGSAIGDANPFWNSTDLDALKSGLLQGYDRLTRPDNFKTATKLSVGITVLHIELIESTAVLETHAWLAMNWTDSKLKWDPTKHNDIDAFRVTADEIWQPDLTVYNSAEERIVDHFAKTNKIVYSRGEVLWVPTAKFQTYCDLDLRFWPFDEQTCIIKLGSWTFDSTKIHLGLRGKDPIEMAQYKSMDWIVKNYKAEYHTTKYPCCDELYEDITFSFVLERRSPMYKAIAVVPTVAIVCMVLVAFWLPPYSGEKLLLNGISCITICIMLMYFSHLFPVMAASPPLIVCFYSSTLYLVSVSLIISVIVINISRKAPQSQPPSFIKTIFLNGFIEKIFACRKSESEKTESENIEEGGKAGSSNADWFRISIVIDRIAFTIYVIIFICMGFLHFI